MKPFTSTLIAYTLLLCIILGSTLAGCSIPGIYHPVQSGETLAGIARIYGRSEAQLARVNGITSPQPLQNGERLFIPGATSLQRNTVKIQPESKLTPSVARAKSTSVRRSSAQQNLPSKDDNNGKKTATLRGKTVVPKPVAGCFSWPLQGTVLRRFGNQNPFPCKGIEIAAPPGTPVLASAAGRVIYSGNGISSFGNMIILRHDGDFYTVYAFAQKNFAKVGSFVSQKERIALSGVPPQGRSPRLYFELRHHKEPVDPTFYLP